MTKSLLIALVCLCLTACASGPKTAATTASPTAAAAPKAVQEEPSTDMADRLQASWVNTASEGLSLRSGRAVGIATLRQLDAACQKGLFVEVIAPPSAARDALAHTRCIAVWRTMDPAVARSPQVLLVDGYSLVVEGMLRHSNSKPVQQEASARAYLKHTGQAERLR